LNRALDLGNGFTPSLYENVLDNGNSNVDAFVENMPDEVRYDLDIQLNPLGDISNGNDFLYFESALKASLALEVPLAVIANDLGLENVAKPDLPGDAERPAITEGTLHLFANNGFPFDARVVLDIVDWERNVLSPLEVEGELEAGLLGANGIVSTPVRSQVSARLSPAQVALLYGEGRIRTRVIFNTDPALGHVRIYDLYGVDLQFTVEGNFIVNSP
ncbi:MAG: hypothetical protein ACO1NQ_02940, partial [Flavobacteriales bacterium]